MKEPVWRGRSNPVYKLPDGVLQLFLVRLCHVERDQGLVRLSGHAYQNYLSALGPAYGDEPPRRVREYYIPCASETPGSFFVRNSLA